MHRFLPLQYNRDKRAPSLDPTLPLAPELPEPGERRISIGEIRASAQPETIKTLLGSCVAVCLHDPVTRIGGMNHILLPAGTDRDKSARFGVHAMELLINALMQLGAQRSSLVAKAFGGANVLACLRPPTVGDLNVRFVLDFLAAEGIPLLGQRLGGSQPVEVRFKTETGQAFLSSVNGLPLSALVAEEKRAQVSAAQRPAQHVATLF
jgi:chemotaxis receptor (MCP) glutamine deamidase CheD